MEGKASLAQVMAAGAQARGGFEPPIGDPLGILDGSAATTRHRRGEEVYGPEDPAEHWFRLVSGMARKCAIKADGRRQIVDFLLPGDFFGLITRHEHRFAVEAVVDGTEVARYPRGRIERLADFDPRIGRLIREAAFEAISRSQARMLILGRMSAQERVGAFLIEMAERSHDGARDGVVLLMSCYDIADYLPPRRSAVPCRNSGRAARSGSRARTGSGSSIAPLSSKETGRKPRRLRHSPGRSSPGDSG